MIHKRLLRLTALLTIGIGCSSEQSANHVVALAPGVSVTTTLESLAILPPIVMGRKPTAVIRASATDNHYDLDNTPGIARLSTGDIVVAPNLGPLRIFSASGEHRVTIGQKGSGPGEFRQIIHLGVIHGDTIVSYDNELSRVSYFMPDGRFVRSMPLGRDIGQSQGAFSEAGWFVGPVATGPSSLHEDDATVRDSLSVVAIHPVDSARVHIEDLLGAWRTRTGTLPFTPRPLIAVAGKYVAITSGDDFVVRLYAHDTLLREIRVDLPRRRVTDEDLNKAGKTQIASSADQAAYERHMQEARSHAVEFHGQIARLMADSAGNVWVLPTFSMKEGTPREWIVFGPDGRARARFPEKVDGGHVWSVGTDYVIIDRFVDGVRTAIEVWGWPLERMRDK